VRILIDGGALSGQAGARASEFWGSFLPALAQRLARCEICLLSRGPIAAIGEPTGVRTFHAPPVDYDASAWEDRRLRALARALDADVFLSTCHTSAGVETPSVYVAWETPPGRHGPRASSRRAARMAVRHLALGDGQAAQATEAHGLPLSLFRMPSLPTAPALAALAAETIEALADRPLVLDDLQARRTAEERTTATLAARLKAAEERRAVRRHRLARWARAAAQPRRYLEYLGRLVVPAR
jgi:hypothetical protein